MGARVMILAGGTGGHVYPALAVARELLEGGHEVFWMGTRKGLEARVVPAAGIPVEWLAVAGIRGKGWRGALSAPLMLMRALLQAGSIVRRIRPDVVLGMGGFVSGPGGVVARLQRIPLVLHEQNRVPGTTNRWLAKRANVVLEAFPDSFSPSIRARCTGNPLRREISVLARSPASVEPGSPLKILVVGGSLGAKALNETVPDALTRLRQPLAIRHQTGEAMRAETAARYAQTGLQATVEAYVEDMAEAYGWADLAICRAGAMTVSELSAAGLPAILVPYPHAIDDHQTRNAQFLAEAGAAVLLPQTTLAPENLAQAVADVLLPPDRLAGMARQSRNLARPEAARAVAEICLEQAGLRHSREDRA